MYCNEHFNLSVNAFTDYKWHTQYNRKCIIICLFLNCLMLTRSIFKKWCHWVIHTFSSSRPPSPLSKSVPHRMNSFKNPEFCVLHLTYHLLLSNTSSSSFINKQATIKRLHIIQYPGGNYSGFFFVLSLMPRTHYSNIKKEE